MYYLFLLGAARVLSGVSPNGLARSRRNTGPKPETPFRRSAELDFGFLPVATPAGMHTCYPELQLSTHAAGLIAHHLSCETLPESLQKPQVSVETQLRTSAARTLPRTAKPQAGFPTSPHHPPQLPHPNSPQAIAGHNPKLKSSNNDRLANPGIIQSLS